MIKTPPKSFDLNFPTETVWSHPLHVGHGMFYDNHKNDMNSWYIKCLYKLEEIHVL